MRYISQFLCWLLLSANCVAINVAFTVDDLPVGGNPHKNQSKLDVMQSFLDTFSKHNMNSIYGMVNGYKSEQNPEDIILLYSWLTAGHKLGNHTYSHLDLVQTTADIFIADIVKNNDFLMMFRSYGDNSFFRYPFLSYGENEEKYDKVKSFLRENNYKVVHVTLDFFDYLWQPAYERCLAQNNWEKIKWLKKTFLEQAEKSLAVSHELSILLFNRDIEFVQLYHLYPFHALMLDELLTLYKQLEVNFIDLPRALQDPVYNIDPKVYEKRTHNFLHSIRKARGLDNPDLVKKYYDEFPEAELTAVCTAEST